MFKAVNQFIFALLLLSMAACSSGGGGANDDADNSGSGDDTSMDDNGNNTGNDDSDDNTSVNTGQFDLADYLFHDNTDTVGGSISYTLKVFSQETGNMILEDTEEVARINDNTITFTFAEQLNKSFIIGSSVIEEILHDLDDISRDTQRFVDIGTTYMDATNTSGNDELMLTQNARCTVIEHLDSFDTSTATGMFALTSGVYQDVLNIRCITSFVSEDGTLAPHTDINHFFARGRGVIFQTGSALFIGETYFITEF